MHDIKQTTSGESTESHVTELEVDDVSLPGMCGIGLLQMCPHIESVKLVFRLERPTFKVLQHLTLPGLTELCLQEGRSSPGYDFDGSVLCSIVTERFPQLTKISLIDIWFPYWNESVKTILGSIRQHNTLKTIR